MLVAKSSNSSSSSSSSGTFGSSKSDAQHKHTLYTSKRVLFICRGCRTVARVAVCIYKRSYHSIQ
jgi:hypothetical protein